MILELCLKHKEADLIIERTRWIDISEFNPEFAAIQAEKETKQMVTQLISYIRYIKEQEEK